MVPRQCSTVLSARSRSHRLLVGTAVTIPWHSLQQRDNSGTANHFCCLQCCLPSGIMGIVEVEESAPESLAEAEDASLCCLKISSSRVRRLTCLTNKVLAGVCSTLGCPKERTNHGLLLFLDLLVKLSSCKWLWVARGPRARGQRRCIRRRVSRAASCRQVG